MEKLAVMELCQKSESNRGSRNSQGRAKGISGLAEDKSAGRRRCLVKRTFLVLLTTIFLQNSAHAADKLRIGFSELIASYSSLPVGQKRGFLQEDRKSTRLNSSHLGISY